MSINYIEYFSDEGILKSMSEFDGKKKSIEKLKKRAKAARKLHEVKVRIMQELERVLRQAHKRDVIEEVMEINNFLEWSKSASWGVIKRINERLDEKISNIIAERIVPEKTRCCFNGSKFGTVIQVKTWKGTKRGKYAVVQPDEEKKKRVIDLLSLKFFNSEYEENRIKQYIAHEKEQRDFVVSVWNQLIDEYPGFIRCGNTNEEGKPARWNNEAKKIKERDMNLFARGDGFHWIVDEDDRCACIQIKQNVNDPMLFVIRAIDNGKCSYDPEIPERLQKMLTEKGLHVIVAIPFR